MKRRFEVRLNALQMPGDSLVSLLPSDLITELARYLPMFPDVSKFLRLLPEKSKNIESSVRSLCIDVGRMEFDYSDLHRFTRLSKLDLYIPYEVVFEHAKYLMLHNYSHLRIVICKSDYISNEASLRASLAPLIRQYNKNNARLSIFFHSEAQEYTSTEIVLLEKHIYFKSSWYDRINPITFLEKSSWQCMKHTCLTSEVSHRMIELTRLNTAGDIFTDITGGSHRGKLSYHFLRSKSGTENTYFERMIRGITGMLMEHHADLHNISLLRIPLAASFGVGELVSKLPHFDEYEFLVDSKEQICIPDTQKRVTFYRMPNVSSKDIDRPEYPIYDSIENAILTYVASQI